MRLFQLNYIKDEMRRRGDPVSKDTNKTDICVFYNISKNSSYKTICKFLGIEYPKIYREIPEAKKVYLYFCDKVIFFKSLARLQEFIGIYILGGRHYDLINKGFCLGNDLVYFSFNKQDISLDSLLPVTCTKFLLVLSLKNSGVSFRIGVSNKEIYQHFHVPFPNRDKLKLLCKMFDSPYYPPSGERYYHDTVSIGAISDRGDIMSFNSIGDASIFFETHHDNIVKSIKHDIGFPFSQTLWHFTRL